jgi:hypothetical protein
MDVKHFDLLAAKIKDAKRSMTVELNRQMFTSVADFRTLESWRPSRVQLLRRRLGRVLVYFRTLWAALRGVELEEPNEDYY